MAVPNESAETIINARFKSIYFGISCGDVIFSNNIRIIKIMRAIKREIRLRAEKIMAAANPPNNVNV
jgi:hypothetical protein